MAIKIVWGRSIGWNISLNTMVQTTQPIPGINMNISQIITDGVDCYPWMEYFAIIPRKTISGKRIFWEKAYKRKVWIVWGSGYHMEPEVQYATIFDLISE